MLECFMCGTPADHSDTLCRYCGANLDTYRMILDASDRAYNAGLAKAKCRDLSGAIADLFKALRFNKRNTKARNLLGLVYMEIGETVLALREWVISKNFDDTPDNLAQGYLAQIQNDSRLLERMDLDTRKFNAALDYSKQGNLDLARIQLKRLIQTAPKMVRAHQLLALIYIHDGKYLEARKELHAAARVDIYNSQTAAYLAEVRQQLDGQKGEKKRKIRKREPLVMDFTDGHDTVRMPRQTFIEALDNSKSGILNILLGAALGVLICMFLVVPQVRQTANGDAAQALVNANNKAASSESDVASLKATVKKLKKRLSNYEGKADIKQSYEMLAAAADLYAAEDLDGAAGKLKGINTDLLEKNGKSLYKKIGKAVEQKRMEDSYAEGERNLSGRAYQGAIDAFTEVVKLDENYEDGMALYHLAEAYVGYGNKEKAKECYEKVVQKWPWTEKGRNARKWLADYAQDLAQREGN